MVVEDAKRLAIHYEEGRRDLLLVVGSVLRVVNLRLLRGLVQDGSASHVVFEIFVRVNGSI